MSYYPTAVFLARLPSIHTLQAFELSAGWVCPHSWEAVTVKLLNILLIHGYNSVSALGQLQFESPKVKCYMYMFAKAPRQLLQNMLLANVIGGKYLWRSWTPEALLD